MPKGFSQEELIEAAKTPAVIAAFFSFPLSLIANMFNNEIRIGVLTAITVVFLMLAVFIKSQTNRILSAVFAVLWGIALALVVVLQSKANN